LFQRSKNELQWIENFSKKRKFVYPRLIKQDAFIPFPLSLKQKGLAASPPVLLG
jgi:hypothetical protein